MTPERSEFLKISLNSLFKNTKLPYELIVVDNGGNPEDSKYLLELTENGKINTYIRNHLNMSFGYARNQALRVCNGDYICVADNDIEYYDGWLEACIKVLEAYPGKKIYATPVYNVAHWLPRFWSRETLEVDGEIYRLNSRAGSNCWVMKRKDFEEVGEFLIHRVAGTKWTEEAIEKGYLSAVAPALKVKDMGFRQGYNTNDPKPIKMILNNGKEVFFNQDEFKRLNKHSCVFLEQKKFNSAPRIRFKENSD
jgi:glycosyltransferase involved in cell wall biosynthesis